MSNVLLLDKFRSFAHHNGQLSKETSRLVFGKKVGLITKLLGCWHDNLSRPFAQHEIAYRSCLQCGARRQFNPETWETYGNFYFPPIIENKAIETH